MEQQRQILQEAQRNLRTQQQSLALQRQDLDALESAVNDSTQKALNEKGLRPALQPKIEVKEFDEGKDLVYHMNVEVLPEFEVMDLKKLKLEKPVTKADKESDKIISKELLNAFPNIPILSE